MNKSNQYVLRVASFLLIAIGTVTFADDIPYKAVVMSVLGILAAIGYGLAHFLADPAPTVAVASTEDIINKVVVALKTPVPAASTIDPVKMIADLEVAFNQVLASYKAQVQADQTLPISTS
jgi:hypothetical protein